MIKIVALLAFVAAAQAGLTYSLDGHGAVGAQAESTVRGFGGLSTVSHQSKTVNSPFSTSSKSDTRVTNDAARFAYAAPAVAYAQPAAYAAAPVAHAAPVAYAQPAYAAAPVAHAAPVAYAHQAPSVTYSQGPAVARVTAPVAYAAPVAKAVAAPVAYAAQAPLAYAAPVAKAVAAPVAYGHPAVAKAAPASLLGVAYSAVPGVATLTFDGFGVHYGY